MTLYLVLICPMISPSAIYNQLKNIGVQGYPALMVHTSMRRVGAIEGGGESLISIILDSIGPQGNLIMVLGADDEKPFDAFTSEADKDMGVLPELFRKWAGVKVNDHAAARYAVLGPQAEYLLNPTKLHDYHGPDSVLDRMMKMDGAVLRLGADIDTVTLTHFAEYLAVIPDKRRICLRYERCDTGEQWIESLDDCDGIFDWELGDYFPQILLDYLAKGLAQVGPVGNCTAELLPAKSFVAFSKKWIEDKVLKS